MRKLLALPAVTVLAVALSAQGQPELVVSVGHSHGPQHVAFAGRHLATATWSTVALDLSTGLTVAHLQTGHVTELEASPAEDIIAVGTCDRSVELWDVSSRRRLHRISVGRECVYAVSFSPDGALLAIVEIGCCAGDDCCSPSGSVQIWDVHAGTLKRELAVGAGISRAVFGGDGRWLAVTDDEGKTTVLEWPSGRQLRTFGGIAGTNGGKHTGLVSPNGRYLAWLGAGAPQVWDVESGTRVALPEQEMMTTAAESLNDGRLAWVDEDRLKIVTLPNGPIEERPLEKPETEWKGDVGITQAPEWRRIHRNGENIAGTYGSRTVLWDTGAARLRDLTSPALMDADALQWSRVGVIAWKERYAHVGAWSGSSGQPLEPGTDDRDDTRREQLIARFEHPMAVRHVAFSPDGRWSAAAMQADYQNAVKVWPGKGGGDGVTLDADEVTYGPQPPAFSSDSRWLATFSKGKSLMLWSTESWKLERTWTLPATGEALMFAPRGPRLAIATRSGAAIWDGLTGRRLVTLARHGSSRVTQIAWSPDGDRVVTLADDGVLRFWNASDGRRLASLYVLGSTGDWLLVTPDGRLDGSEGAVATVVAWRKGARVSLDERLTERRRVRHLWRRMLRGRSAG